RVAGVQRVGGRDLVLVVPLAFGLLARQEHLRALPVPGVAADLLEEAQRAHALDAVEVVEVPRLALRRVLVDRPVRRQPREAVVDALVDLLAALLAERLAEDRLGDEQAADARAGHRAADLLLLGLAPRLDVGPAAGAVAPQ